MDLPRPIIGAAVGAALLAASLIFFLSIGSASDELPRPGEPPPTATPCLTPDKVPIATALQTPASTDVPEGFGCGTPVPTNTPPFDHCAGCAISLEIVAVNGTPTALCSSIGSTVEIPTKCILDKGDTFTLHINASTLPDIGSYGTYQTLLGYGTLFYRPDSPANENHWPDGILGLRSPDPADGTEGNVQHGDPGAFTAPLPASTYTDELVELGMNCPPGGGQAHTLALLPYSGSPQFGADGMKEFFLGRSGSTYVGGTFEEPFSIVMPVIGERALDLNGDGQLDHRYLIKATPTPPFIPEPTATPAINVGDIIDYPIHALVEINCGDVPPSLTPSSTPTPTSTPTPISGNDDFTDAIEIGVLPYVAKQNTFGSTTEPGEPTNPNGCITFFPAIKGATVWYRYTPPVNTTITADTFIESGGFDTVLAVYTGTAVNALTPVACNDDSGSLQSRVQFPAIGGTTYHFQVGGFDGRTGDLRLTVTSSGGATITPTPTITATPCLTPGKVPIAKTGGCGTITPTPTTTPSPTPCLTPGKIPLPSGCATLTPTPTETPTPPAAPPVGGIGFEPDIDALTSASPASFGSRIPPGGLVTAVAGVLGVLGGVVWYAKRRSVSG